MVGVDELRVSVDLDKPVRFWVIDSWDRQGITGVEVAEYGTCEIDIHVAELDPLGDVIDRETVVKYYDNLGDLAEHVGDINGALGGLIDSMVRTLGSLINTTCRQGGGRNG